MSEESGQGIHDWVQQTAASIMLQWLRELQSQQPLAARLVEKMFILDSSAVLHEIADNLGQQRFNMTDIRPNLGLSGYLESQAGVLADQQLGQVSPSHIWFDPPWPEPGQRFKVFWEERNIGYLITGDYTTMIRLGNAPLVLVDSEPLQPGGYVLREYLVEGLPAGFYRVYVATPWLGSDNSTLSSPAGRTIWESVDLAVGQEASAQQQSHQEKSAVSDALTWAKSYIDTFISDDAPDLHPLSYALQWIARVAQKLDSQCDLQGTATALLSRDPATVRADTFAQARSQAKDASVVLTSAVARITMDNASPVDHEMTDQAARAILAAATTIEQAEPAESPADEFEYAGETTDEQGEGFELEGSEDTSGETTEEVLAEAEGQSDY
jgi:hypothetical protein